MLIALELAGFKSFADKTRFDFPDGITVIVGPNGSGKSNVVDAIKWVLGAQSAKALRGKDMVDVIFKGSSASGRRAANSAEATLIFDNSGKQLGIDSQEVHVTRRVYRSGESEYLLNNQACRLKDVRDLFRGTGVGVDAYSLIEQGKVDRMLQASPKDRRVIFEEAAGISRFNAKKAEAARRLQRVDQNLVRLKDIVDEVRTRLSSIKNQATKAQRFREMTERIQEIRRQLGWTEYRSLLEQKEHAATRLAQLTQDRDSKSAELTEAHQAAQQAELELHRVAEDCQKVEALLQEALQRIAVGENQQSSLRQRVDEGQETKLRHENRLTVLLERVQGLQLAFDAAEVELAKELEVYTLAKLRSETSQQRYTEIQAAIAERTAKYESVRKSHVELLREVSQQATELAKQRSLLADISQSILQTEESLAENRNAEEETRSAAEDAGQRLKRIYEQNQQATEQLSAAREQLDDNQVLLSKHQAEAAVLQGRLEGAAERVEILEQLQQHLEGVDAGARYLLERKNESQEPAFQSVQGLVAELLEVDVELAPLIDTALGNSANAVVVSDGQLFQMARSGKLEVPGRLSLMRLDRIPNRRFGEKVQLDGVHGVIGRADHLVRFRQPVEALFRYLLGTTWLVESLDVALDLGHFRGAGLRFVTADCQVIESDGTLTIGSLQSSAGLVSRRSEILDAKREIVECKQRYQSSHGEIERLKGRIDKLKPSLAKLEASSKELSQEFAHQQAKAQAAVAKLDEMELRANQFEEQLIESRAKRAALEPVINQALQLADEAKSRIAELESALASHEVAIAGHNAQMQTVAEEHTSAEVELARGEQKLQAAESRLLQCTASLEERQQSVEETQAELKLCEEKKREAELAILDLTSQLAIDTQVSESEDAKLDVLAERAAELRQRRSTSSKLLDAVSKSLDKISQLHVNTQAELSRAEEATIALRKRFSDDYQIELDQLDDGQVVVDAETRAAMEFEAAKIRQDLGSVGEINMAALNELDELQQRYDFLNDQYEDLQAAKESLQRIIQKINNDSRRLFMETLEAIRLNFQKLYRKSFGGGNADIVLEAGADVLECGIDIVATPPGKTELSNSLLSGGEKALTAVALLLAIFQYRPSPFCVLDEVDAPFDEANIGRFVNVLTEFLDWTKFIIVTHSKKTMTASTTLYGITMQESGVSKQVAVRFEDVNEKGEIMTAERRASQRRAA